VSAEATVVNRSLARGAQGNRRSLARRIRAKLTPDCPSASGGSAFVVLNVETSARPEVLQPRPGRSSLIDGWTKEIHFEKGNVCFGDGSVGQFAKGH
jgi:prepilin-type processing-associated H-X9-DG protein